MGDQQTQCQPKKRQTEQPPSDVAIEWQKQNEDQPHLNVHEFGITKALFNTLILLKAINFTVKLFNNNVSSFSKINSLHMQLC